MCQAPRENGVGQKYTPCFLSSTHLHSGLAAFAQRFGFQTLLNPSARFDSPSTVGCLFTTWPLRKKIRYLPVLLLCSSKMKSPQRQKADPSLHLRWTNQLPRGGEDILSNIIVIIYSWPLTNPPFGRCEVRLLKGQVTEVTSYFETPATTASLNQEIRISKT